MEKIEELRLKIDEIDKQMAKLFEQRMLIVKDIAIEKKKLALPIYDQGRETFILIRNGSYIEDREIRIMYFDILNKMFENSKKMQDKILHEN